MQEAERSACVRGRGMLERGREGAARQKCSFFYLQLMMSRAWSSSTSSLNRPGLGLWLGPGLGLGLCLQFLLTVVLVVDSIYFSAIENWVILFFIFHIQGFFLTGPGTGKTEVRRGYVYLGHPRYT